MGRAAALLLALHIITGKQSLGDLRHANVMIRTNAILHDLLLGLSLNNNAIKEKEIVSRRLTQIANAELRLRCLVLLTASTKMPTHPIHLQLLARSATSSPFLSTMSIRVHLQHR